MQGDDGVAAVGGGEGRGVVAGLGVVGIVPEVAAAGGGFDSLGHRAEECEGHVDHGVAAVGSRQRDGLSAGGGEDHAVPSVRQRSRADGRCEGGGLGLVDGQIQGVDLRAADDIKVAVGVDARLGVGLSVAVRPRVGSAFGDGDSRARRVVDGQVEGVDLRATVVVEVAVGVVAAFRVGLSVPRVVAALGDGHGLVHRVVDGQVEGVDLRATVVVKMTVGVRAGGLIDSAVPGVGAAFGDGDGLVHRVEDGQVEGVDLRASVDILMAVGVVARDAVDRAVPSVGTASFSGVGVVHRSVDHEHHRHHGVAAVGGFDGGRLHTGLVEGHAVPLVGQFAGADGIGDHCAGTVQDGQMQGVDLCASVGVKMAVGVVARGNVGLSVAVRPDVGTAGTDGDRRVHRVEDGQVEGVDLCASVGVEVAVSVVAGSGVGLSVPSVGAALADGDGLVHRVEDGQVEGVDLRTTVGVEVAVSVVAGGGVGLSVPGVGTALGDGDGLVHRVEDG